MPIESRPIKEKQTVREVHVPAVDLSKSDSVIESITVYTNKARGGEFEALKSKHVKMPYSYKNLSLMEPVNLFDGTATKYERDKSFYFDAPYVMMLGGKVSEQTPEKPLAVAAFNDDRYCDDRILIRQLQGRLRKNPLSKEERDILAAYRWEFILVDLIQSWAAQAGVSSIAIQSAYNSSWIHSVPESILKLRYDRTAKRLGFNYDNQSGNYSLPLREMLR